MQRKKSYTNEIIRRILISVMLTSFNPLIVLAQNWTFTKDGVEFVVELPSPAWRVTSRVDIHPHVEFVNGNNELDGYLRLTKILVDSDTTAADLFQSDEKWSLQHLPGYVACGDCQGEAFRGHVSGAAFSYEYTSGGRAMTGRVYYLQLDKRTFYALRFTLARDKLQSVSEQMDFIARSFRLK
jgi:hypothetical protein